MEINISVVNDNLSDDEMKKLLQCIREIEQNKPERHISIFIDSPDSSVKDMKELISSVKPGFPYVTVIPFDKKVV